ncbi:lebercilin isoform X1 [Acipenser oxyrinchus oxyrinchus]|uniref:Lebercilin isoform X1 n=1 Tax=Acipenser oxyrinchus oxyrinchus TaxID=40147 RepID=A0AAD8GAG8_ACIOX|nr:lebercilin isoform X1 [Acipenser oxyrinchus oxyrinchus]
MDSPRSNKLHEDNRETERNLHSHRSTDQDSEASYKTKHDSDQVKADCKSTMGDRGRTRTRERDHNSHYDKNSDSYYSDDYDHDSYESDHSHSRSRTPSPRRKENMKRISSSPAYKQGLKKKGTRNLTNKTRGLQKWGFHSQSLNKEPMPKDLDLVTKRMLSARLLKINELKNEMSEQQLCLEELQKENKVLRRLQHRQEKALNKFEDTESEIAQLISSHSNEVRTLRERLRKSQEKERTTERRLKDSEEELYRTKSSLQKLRKLAEDKQLAERDELARKLTQADVRLEDNDRRVKDLEKNLELSNSSFQRQLAAERKKAHEAQEDAKNMRDELERLSHKLKEKERELDTKNIYANRMLKPSPKKDADITQRKKALNQNTTKGVQTDENLFAIEFPPPPPAITDETIDLEEDDYFSLKDKSHQAVQGRATVSGPSVRKTPQRKIIKEQENKEREAAERQRVAKERQEREKEREEKLRRDQEQHALEDKARRLREEWEREEMERKRREKELYQQQQEERERKLKDQDQQSLEEERRKKDLLLARMREVDLETQGPDIFSDFSSTKPTTHSQADQTQKILKFSESVNNLHSGVPSHRSSDSIRKPDSSGRRAIKTVDSSENLTFGSYAPSFGKTSGRTGLSSKKSESPEEKDKDNFDTAFENNKKSNLMQQLFGASASANADVSTLEILNLPAASKTTQDTGGAFPWEKSSPAKKKDPFFNVGKTPSANMGRPHIAADRPAVRAINSLEDEIEELIL